MRKILVGIVLSLMGINHTGTEDVSPETYLLAVKIHHKLAQTGERPSFIDIVNIIETSTRLGTNCLPRVLSREDFISIAYVESRFNPYVIGDAKETGTWQVLEWQDLMHQVGGSNPFDIETNAKMACKELQIKSRTYHIRKDLIRSYNGWSIAKGWTYVEKVDRFKKEVFPELFPKPATKSKIQKVSLKKIRRIK